MDYATGGHVIRSDGYVYGSDWGLTTEKKHVRMQNKIDVKCNIAS